MRTVLGLFNILIRLHLIIFFASANISNLNNNGYDDDENRQYIKENEEETEISSNHFTDTIPGDPEMDYPTYKNIPKTGFSCKGKLNWHYYADIDTDCQVFHICETQYSKISFLCPPGSIFNQRHLVCDWWYNFDCYDAESFYELDNDQTLLLGIQEEKDRNGFDLSLASSGGNSDPQRNPNKDPKTANNSTNEFKRRDRYKN